jgi:anhydro-N-acetylmuramic acid kinase
VRVIGMMSGTSFDAVDAAAADLELRGDVLELRPLGRVARSYPDEILDRLRSALPPAPTTMADVCRLDTGIGQVFAELAARADRELCAGRAELVVSHGQTVYHWAEDGRVRGTLQLGGPAWIAERTGLPVVSDLRSRDVAAGGQGAPLVSALDVLWLAGRRRRSVALNLGGIANVTVVAPDTVPIAYDTGPANALLDAYVQHVSAGRLRFDRDGALAAEGRVDPQLLSALLAEEYYRRPAPKSTGKELFNLDHLRRFADLEPGEVRADVVATLTALTAESVAAAVRSATAEEVIVAGGGTRNPTMLAMLRDRLPGVAVLKSDDLGLPAADKEAYAFAVLGFLSVHGLPGTIASCTGAAHPSVLGSLTPGAHGLPARPPAEPPNRLVIRGTDDTDPDA